MLYAVLIHILLCALVYCGMQVRLLNVQKQLMPVVVLVPLWGVLCVLLLHCLHAAGWEGTVEAGVEKLHTNEEAHRSLLTEDLNQQRSVVPLQEALILNDSRLRRGMLLDVLYENPDDYHALLNEAIDHEDGEVVHYATTAMAELSKKYEVTLHFWEKKYASHPEDLDVLKEYCDFLEKYLERNLLQGQMELVQRRQHAILLERRLEKEPSLNMYQRLASALMNLGEFLQANEWIDRMQMLWPEDEATLLCQLELAVRTGDTGRMKEILQKAHAGERYLSLQGRQKLAFFEWNQNVQTEGDA